MGVENNCSHQSNEEANASGEDSDGKDRKRRGMNVMRDRQREIKRTTSSGGSDFQTPSLQTERTVHVSQESEKGSDWLLRKIHFP